MKKALVWFYCYLRLRLLRTTLRKRNSFNTQDLDSVIMHVSTLIYSTLPSPEKSVSVPDNGAIGCIVTELYVTGGHSPCVTRFVASVCDEYHTFCFITKPRSEINNGGDGLAETSTVIYSKTKKNQMVLNIVSIYQNIVSSGVSVLFFFVDKSDMASAVLLSMLKQYTAVKLIIYNQSDHFPYLGAVFSHLVLDFRPESQAVSLNERLAPASKIIPLQCGKANEDRYLSDNALRSLRQKIGINDEDFFTLTGCSSYKLLLNDDFTYFEVIKALLTEEPRLKHVIMSDFTDEQHLKIKAVFHGAEEAFSRLIFQPLVADYEKHFQACDVFIDSFPVGSALTHIDMMRFKKPTVVKINKQQPLYSFEFYLPEGYPYVYSDVEAFKQGVRTLIKDKCERQRMGEFLHNYYLETHEFDAVKGLYKAIISDCQR